MAGELPTRFELTRDEKWKAGGELFEVNDLGIDSGIVVEQEADIPDEHSGGVRVPGEIGDEEKNTVDEKEPEIETPLPTFISEDIDLEKEFNDVLTLKGPRKTTEVPSGVLLV